MSKCLACGSRAVRTKEVPVLRLDLNGLLRLKKKTMKQTTCETCQHVVCSDEALSHPSADKGMQLAF